MIAALVTLALAAAPTPGHVCPKAPPGPGALASAPRCFPAFQSRIAPLDGAIRASMRGSSFHAGCPVGLDALAEVTVSFWDLQSQIETGRIVVAKRVAKDVVEVFRRLYLARFPVARMTPVDAFAGDDDRAMAADDTSGFNCRVVAGSTRWSEHARGEAIDLNPLENPMVSRDGVKPPAGQAFVDRHLAPGVVVRGGPAWRAFRAVGWKWGGAWRALKDYQHFSPTGR